MAKPQTVSCNIKVGVRLRPLLTRENLELKKWKCEGKQVSRFDPETGKVFSTFLFDEIYDETSTNEDIFSTMVEPLIEKAVKGFNATVLAYGQTSSGKTYTMMGTETSKGIVPLCMEYIFQAIDKLPDERCFLLGVSFLEVYNEKVRDLLCPEKTDIKIHEALGEGITVDCKTEMVSNAWEMMDLLEQGNRNKAIGETNMNERSSRSHTIFRITVESKESNTAEDECVARVSHINLVDLAGSERASQTGAIGQRYKEGCAINRSLLQLGNVVQKLSEGKGEFIDYRSSKLTRILQPSLSGNANIAMICNITSVAMEQTQCTLVFASRASAIKLAPHLNEMMDDATLIKRHSKRIRELEMKLKNAEQLEEKNQTLQKEMDRLREMVIMSSFHVKEQRQHALRRQTWGGLESRRKLPLLPTLQEHPPIFLGRHFSLVSIPERSDVSGIDSSTTLKDGSMDSSLDTSNLSNEEQPSSMSLTSEVQASLEESNASNMAHVETPPAVLRKRILHLQKNVDNSGTPQSVLREKIKQLENRLSEISSCHPSTSSEVLKERLSILSEYPATPVSIIKEKLISVVNNSQPVTPPIYLRDRINQLTQDLENLELEYKSLQEFTTLERQCNTDLQLLQENESLKHSLEDCESLYNECLKQNSELKHEHEEAEEMIAQLQLELANSKKEMETNKMWNFKNNEEQLKWKKELMDCKEKLAVVTNASKDWKDEKDLLKCRYEEKINELQSSLGEAWTEQESLKKIIENRAVATLDFSCQTNKDEEECDSLRERMFFMSQEIENLKMDFLVKEESLKFTNTEIERLKKELSHNNKNYVTLLREKEDAHSQELQTLRDTINKLSEENITLTSANIKIQGTSCDLDDKLMIDKKLYESISLDNNHLKFENNLTLEELKDLTTNYTQLQKENEANKLYIEDMQNKIDEIAEEKKRLISKIQELHGNGVFEYQHDSWTTLGPEIPLLKPDSDHLQGSENDSLSTHTELEVPTNTIAQTLEQLKLDYKLVSQKNAELSSQLNKTLEVIKQQELLADLPSHLTGSSPEIGEFLSHYIRQLLDTNTSLESKLFSLKNELSQLQEENVSLSTQLANTIEKSENQIVASNALMQQVSDLQVQLNDVNSLSCNGESQKDVDSCVKKLVSEIQCMDTNYTIEALSKMHLSELVNTLIECIIKKQHEVYSCLQNEMGCVQEKNIKMKSDLEEKIQEIQELKCAKNECLQQLKEYEAELSSYQTSNSVQQLEIQRLLHELEESDAQHKQEILTLQSVLSDTQQKAERLDVYLNEIKQSYKNQEENIISELGKKLNTANDSIIVLKNELMVLKKSNEDIRSEPDGISAEEQIVCDVKVEDLNSSHSIKIMEKDKRDSDSVQKQEDCNVQNDRGLETVMEYGISSNEQKICSLQLALETKTKRIADLEYELHSYVQKFNTCLETPHENDTQIGELKSTIENLEEQLYGMKRELDLQNNGEIIAHKHALEATNDNLKQQISELTIELDRLSSQLKSQGDLTVTNSEHAKCLAELQSTRSQMQRALNAESQLSTVIKEFETELSIYKDKLKEHFTVKSAEDVVIGFDRRTAIDQLEALVQKLQLNDSSLREQIQKETEAEKPLVLLKDSDIDQLEQEPNLNESLKTVNNKLQDEQIVLKEKIAVLTQELTQLKHVQEQELLKYQQIQAKIEEIEKKEVYLNVAINDSENKLMCMNNEIELLTKTQKDLASENAKLILINTTKEITDLKESQLKLEIELKGKAVHLDEVVLQCQQLKVQLAEVNETKMKSDDHFKDELSKMEKELQQYIIRNNEIITDRDSLKGEKTELLEKIDLLNENYSEILKTKVELQAEIAKIKTDNESLQQQLSSIQEKSQSNEALLKSALHDAELKIADFTAQLELQIKSGAELSTEKSALGLELTKVSENLNQALNDFAKVSNELENCQQAARIKCERLEEELVEYQRINSQLVDQGNENKRLNDALKDSDHNVINLKKELQQQTNIIELLSLAKSKLEEEQIEFKEQCNQLTEELKEMSTQLKSQEMLNSKLQHLEKELLASQQLYKQYEEALEKECKLRASTEINMTKIEVEFREIDANYKELQSQYSEMRRQQQEDEVAISKLQQSLAEAEKFNEEYKKQSTVQEVNIKSLQDDINKRQSEYSKLEIIHQDLQTQLQQAHVAQKQAEISLQNAEALVTTTKSKLHSLSQEYEEQSAMVESLQNDLAKSNMLLNAAQEAKELLTKRLERALKEIDEQKTKLEEAEDEFQDMLTSYRENNAKRTLFEEQVCKLELEVDRLENKIKELEDELKNKSEDIQNTSDFKKALSQYQEELQIKSARLTELEIVAADSVRTITQLEAERMELRRNLADKRGELALLEKKILMDDLPHQQEAERCRRQIANFEQKIRVLQSEIRHLHANRQETTLHGCNINIKKRMQMSSQESQTTPEETTISVAVQAPPDNETLWDRRDGFLPSSAITEAGRMYGMKQQLDEAVAKLTKMQEERNVFKEAIRKRNQYIMELQQMLSNKENKEQQSPGSIVKRMT